MTREQVLEQLTEVFRDVFDNDAITLTETTTAKEIDGWDSLEHIALIVAVERHFKMKFAMKDVVGMKNVGEMVDRILSA